MLMTTNKNHLSSFAKPAFYAENERKRISIEFKDSKDKSVKKQLSMLKHLIDRCIRTSSNLIAPDASVAALKLAVRYNINLFGAKEQDKRAMQEYMVRLNPAENDCFFYEHKETVYELILKISKSETEQDVFSIFKLQEIVWVLNSENNNLIDLGFNSERSNSDEAYNAANINVVKTILSTNDWLQATWSRI